MMVFLLLYAYWVGLTRSRRIEKACCEDAAFWVLTGHQQPDHSRISDFRRCHLAAPAGLFVQALRLREKAGLVRLGSVALDGTEVKAISSKHKATSYQLMLKSERHLEPDMRGLLRNDVIIIAKRTASLARANEPMNCRRE